MPPSSIQPESSFLDWRIVANQIETIFAEIGVAITVQDAAGRVMFANRKAAKLVDLATPTDLLEMKPRELQERYHLYDEDGKTMKWSDLPGRKALRTHTSCEAILCYRDKKTGEESWTSLKAVPIVTKQGKVEGVINMFHDITAFKHAEQRLKQRNKQLMGMLDQVLEADDLEESLRSRWRRPDLEGKL